MISENFCQSCGMPLSDDKYLGTEKDGSKNMEYCVYCYQNGEFVNPVITLKEMTLLVIDQLEKMNIDPKTIDLAVSNLPDLKRWRKNM